MRHVAPAKCVARPDRRHIGQPQMNHERDRRQLQRNPMGRQRHSAQPSHHERGRRKKRHFAQRGQPNGPAQPEHPTQHLEIRTPQPVEDAVLWQHPQRVDHHAHKHDQLRDVRRPGAPRNPHLGRAPIAKDKSVIGKAIGNRAHKGHPKHNLCAFQRRQIAFEGHHDQCRNNPPARDGQIGRPIPRHLLSLAQSQQNRFRPDHQRHGKRGIAHAQPQPHARGAPQTDLVPFGVIGRNHRHDRPGKTRSHQKNHKEQRARHGLRRQLLHSVPAQHDGVRHADRHLPQMSADQRQTKNHNGAPMSGI
mmetsp:Transcript_24122/g.44791  ORF Transcript_24122/g.44791 Transcript_24122/m.44791 type:complete len:305 (+) Transcript_24122:652-1566(+)